MPINLPSLGDQITIEGSLLATNIPSWLRAVTCVWAVLILYGAKYYAVYGNLDFIRQIEQLPNSTILVLVTLGVVSCSPLAAVQWGSRRWLRKYYPEVEVMRWDNDNLTLSNNTIIPWQDVKEIRDCSRLRNPRIEIYTDAMGKNGKVCLPTTLLLYPDRAYLDLRAALRGYRKNVAALRLKTNFFRLEDVQSDKFIRAEVQKKLNEAIGKTASQLKAEGIPTTDVWAIRSYLWNEAFKREKAKLIAD